MVTIFSNNNHDMELKNVICETPEQFHAECEKWAGKGVVRGRKLIAYGETVAELANGGRGGWRNGGRPSIEGKERRWIIPNDILDIIQKRGKAYIWEAVRFKDALDRMQCNQ